MKLNVKLFADGAEKSQILELYKNPIIDGFTTNPTLMKKAGITNYKEFALDILSVIKDRPISFEVFSDDFDEMEFQAKEIASWGENVNVKIPITNTKGKSSIPLIEKLTMYGIKLNVTAMMTIEQVKSVLPFLSKSPESYVSIFAGRIADTGIDPVPIMSEVSSLLTDYPNIKSIWASQRELFNIIQADMCDCHIITVTPDSLKKLSLFGKDLNEYSLETVKMFYKDSCEAGFTI